MICLFQNLRVGNEIIIEKDTKGPLWSPIFPGIIQVLGDLIEVAVINLLRGRGFLKP